MGGRVLELNRVASSHSCHATHAALAFFCFVGIELKAIMSAEPRRKAEPLKGALGKSMLITPSETSHFQLTRLAILSPSAQPGQSNTLSVLRP